MNDYYVLIDIALLGGLLLTLGLILYVTRGEERGAIPASEEEIEIHQKVRRMTNGSHDNKR